METIAFAVLDRLGTKGAPEKNAIQIKKRNTAIVS
jgi:hypothetical protein